MGYRHQDAPKDKPQRIFDVRNGATLKINFRCFYHQYHDTKFHDHLGWPNPGQPDMICQIDKLDDPAPWMPEHHIFSEKELTPINLREEGYVNTYVTLEDLDIEEYAVITSEIDSEDDSIIHVRITVNMPTFTHEPKVTGFTVFVAKEYDAVVDAVCHGIMEILPGAARD